MMALNLILKKNHLVFQSFPAWSSNFISFCSSKPSLYSSIVFTEETNFLFSYTRLMIIRFLCLKQGKHSVTYFYFIKTFPKEAKVKTQQNTSKFQFVLKCWERNSSRRMCWQRGSVWMVYYRISFTDVKIRAIYCNKTGYWSLIFKL